MMVLMMLVMLRFVVVVIKAETAEKVVKIEVESTAAKRRPSAATTTMLERFIAHLIALTPFFRVFQNFVGSADFLEFFVGALFLVFVRMILDGEFLEGFLDLLLGGGRLNTENRVMFTFRQR